jgi:hypothetical protein
MNTKKFKDLQVGDLFYVGDVEYKKIKEVKVSCCKRINAHESADHLKRIKIDPETVVSIK